MRVCTVSFFIFHYRQGCFKLFGISGVFIKMFSNGPVVCNISFKISGFNEHYVDAERFGLQFAGASLRPSRANLEAL